MKIGLLQLNSQLDPDKNIESINSLISSDIRYWFLPECFYSFSSNNQVTPYLVAKDNQHFKNIAKIALEKNVYILGGSVAYEDNGNIKNRVLNFSPDGSLLNFYDKRNLFSCELENISLDESKVYTSGKKNCLLNLEDFCFSFTVCFDLRFPELYRNDSKLGANVFVISAAFTVPTGLAHWEVLLRARAIENQSYVIASAQVGIHNGKNETFGHSMIIDPWGKVLEKLTSVGRISAELDLKLIKEIRKRMNVF